MSKTETKSTVLLKHHLKALKLPTMLAEAEKIAQRCAADNADHLAFLLQLVELELIERERKAAERRLKAARFPAAKMLDEFDFSARPSVNKPQVLELVKGEYLDRRENILLVGPSGTGKTHLATAFGIAACSQGRKVRFFRVTELVTLLLEAKEERHLLRLRQQLAKLDLLAAADDEFVFWRLPERRTLPAPRSADGTRSSQGRSEWDSEARCVDDEQRLLGGDLRRPRFQGESGRHPTGHV